MRTVLRPNCIRADMTCLGAASSSAGPEAEEVDTADEGWGCWEEGMESEAEEEADPEVEVEPQAAVAPAQQAHPEVEAEPEVQVGPDGPLEEPKEEKCQELRGLHMQMNVCLEDSAETATGPSAKTGEGSSWMQICACHNQARRLHRIG